jgi:hypothetical protein
MVDAFVIPKLIGGLGNQLFILASAMDIAIRCKRTLVFNQEPINCHCPDDRSLSALFPEIPFHIGVEADAEYSGDTHSYIDIAPLINPEHRSICITGYNQHPSYIPPGFTNFIHNIPNISPYMQRQDLAFLHVRRTDYVNHPCYPCDTDKYYTAAVQHLLSINPNIILLIVSDDTTWSNPYIQTLLAPLISKERILTLDRDYSATDTLKIMANCCGGAICANSSFSWWGAYLNRERPIYMPHPWSAYDTSLELGLYFEGVHRISSSLC